MSARTALGWRTAADLLADERALRASVAGYGEWLGAHSAPVASALAFKAYSWAVIELAVESWLLRHRVLDVSAPLVAVAGGAEGYRFRVDVPQVVVLPDDPLARSRGAVVAADEAELLDALRATLVDGHLAPAVEAFRRIRGGGARPLWGSVAQSLAYPATVADPDVVGDRAAAARVLLGLLPPDVAALVEVAEIQDAEGWRPMLLRRTCCYAYALPAGDACTTCCLLSDSERDEVADRYGMRWRRLRPESS